MVRRVGGSRRYKPTPDGLTMIGGLWLLRDKVMAPLLGASTTKIETAPLVRNAVAFDQHYLALRTQMQAVLKELGFVGSP